MVSYLLKTLRKNWVYTYILISFYLMSFTFSLRTLPQLSLLRGLLVTNSIFTKIALFCFHCWRTFFTGYRTLDWQVLVWFCFLISVLYRSLSAVSEVEQPTFIAPLYVVGSLLPLMVAFKIFSYLWFSSVLTIMC